MSDDGNDYVCVEEFREAEGTRDWPVLSTGATTFFATDSFPVSARLVQGIAGLASAGEHCSVDVRAGGVTVRLLTVAEDWWGMSRRDIELARRISSLAAELSCPPTLRLCRASTRSSSVRSTLQR